jgi:hypothetical protein
VQLNNTSDSGSAANSSGAGARSGENTDKGVAAAAVGIAIIGLMASEGHKYLTPLVERSYIERG